MLKHALGKHSPRDGGTMLSSYELRLPFQPAPTSGQPALVPETGARTPAAARRRRLWELSGSLHCSIIGTCLTTGELRDILRRVTRREQHVVEGATDHDLHSLGVTLASRSDAPGKLLHKALDQRHAATLKQFQTARAEPAVEALWQTCLGQGAIPGAYWALVTHPSTSDRLVRRAFGEVHMLSHLVGASNRADIRRLQLLEAENARLRADAGRSHATARQRLAERDARIAALTAALQTQAEARALPPAADLPPELALLQTRLAKETAARQHAEQRLAELAAEAADRQHQLTAQQAAMATELAALQAELQALERRLLPDLASQPTGAPPSLPGLDLAELRVLLVGARPGQVQACRLFVERGGGRLLHHDGGLEDKLGMLAGLISRADLVLFPVDCVSHGAVQLIKRVAGQLERPWRALRQASVACLVRTLDEFSPAAAVGPAAPGLATAEGLSISLP